MCKDDVLCTVPRIFRWIVLVLASTALASCAWERAYNKAHRAVQYRSYAHADGGDLAMKSNAVFYLDQYGKTTNWIGSTDLAVSAYHEALASCAGDPTTPVNPADLSKLGYVQTQVWVDDPHRRAAVLQEGYKVVMSGSIEPPTCRFSLERTRILQLWLDDRYYHIDLTKHKGYVVLVGGWRTASVNHATQLAAYPIGKSNVAGQPCTLWHVEYKYNKPQYSATWCTWSGGEPWGLPDDEMQDFPDFHGTPVLEYKNGADSHLAGPGDHTTVRFLIGSLPSTTIFTVPSDVKMGPAPKVLSNPNIFVLPSKDEKR